MAEVTARGLRFHVQRLGFDANVDHTPVLFLHGLVMDNLSSWYFTAATPTAQHAPTLLMDLRGHGRSDRPESGYTVESMVDDVVAVLDASGVTRPVIIVGNSFGGLLGMAAALAHTDRVAGLVLVDAHLSGEGFGDEMASTLNLQGDDRDRAIAENFSNWLGRHSKRKATRLAKTASELVYGTSLVTDLQASVPFEEEALRTMSAPVLALYGEHSDIRARGEQLATLLPNCELRLLSGCTHSIIWEATDVVKQAIVDFVVAHSSSLEG